MENRLTGYFIHLHTPLKQKDIDSLSKNIEAATTYEWAKELINHLPQPPADFTFSGRALWLLRWAYVYGYRAGIDAENNMKATREEQNKRLEHLVCQKILHEGKGDEVLKILEIYVPPGTKNYIDMPFSDCCELEAALNLL